MSDQNVHFEQTGYLTPGSSVDNGQETVQAVKPLANGEDADQTVFNRPLTNLFTRTEAIRQYLLNALYMEDADRAILVQGGGTITWTWGGSSGSFVITADLFIKPFLSPAVSAFSNPATGYIGWDPNNPSLAGASHTTAILITSIAAPTGACPTPPRVYNGANAITLIVNGVAAYGPPSVTTTVAIGPVPTQTITVTVDSTIATNRYIQTGNPNTGIVDALNGTAAFAALGLVAAADPAVVSPATTSLNLATADGAPRQFQGALDAERHRITAADLVFFFAVSSPSVGYNLMQEGDVLAIWYNTITDGSGNYAGRRQSLPDNPETLGGAPRVDNTDVRNNLFLLRNHPERMPYAIPVAAVANQQLVMVSNDRYSSGIPAALGQSAAPSSTTPNPDSLSAGSVGTSPYYARGDHYHQVPTSLTLPVKITPGSGGSVGSSSAVARSDHDHRTDVGNPIAIVPSASVSQGSSSSLARADHGHAAITGTPVTQYLDATNSPGASGRFADASHVHNIPSFSSTPNTVGSAAGSAGSSDLAARGDHTHQHGTIADADDNATSTTYFHGGVVGSTTGANGKPGFMWPNDKRKIDQLPIVAGYVEGFDHFDAPAPFFSTIGSPYSDSILSWLPAGGTIGGGAGSAALGWSQLSSSAFPSGSVNGDKYYLQMDAFLPTTGRPWLKFSLPSGTLAIYASGPQNNRSTTGNILLATFNTVITNKKYYLPLLPAGYQTISLAWTSTGGAVPTVTDFGFWIPGPVDGIQRSSVSMVQSVYTTTTPPGLLAAGAGAITEIIFPENGTPAVIPTGDGIGTIAGAPRVTAVVTDEILFFPPSVPIYLGNTIVIEGVVGLISGDQSFGIGVCGLAATTSPPTGQLALVSNYHVLLTGDYAGASGFTNWTVTAYPGVLGGAAGANIVHGPTSTGDGALHLLRLELSPTYGSPTVTSVTGYIDGVPIGTVNTTIPNNSDQALFAGFYAAGSGNANFGRLDVNNLAAVS